MFEPTHRAIRERQVCVLMGFSRATLWRKVRNETGFPQPFKVSSNITVWDEVEVAAWIAIKKAARDVRQ